MSIFSKWGHAISVWLFKKIVIQNTDKVNSINEYNEILNNATVLNSKCDSVVRYFDETEQIIRHFQLISQHQDEQKSGIDVPLYGDSEDIATRLNIEIVEINRRLTALGTPENLADYIKSIEMERLMEARKNQVLAIRVVDLEERVRELRKELAAKKLVKPEPEPEIHDLPEFSSGIVSELDEIKGISRELKQNKQEISLKTPEIKLNNPDIKIREPEIKEPDIKHEVRKPDKTDEIQDFVNSLVKSQELSAETAELKINAGTETEIDIKSPDIKLNTPEINPDIDFKTPEIKVNKPDIDVKAPEIKVNKPDIKIKQESRKKDSDFSDIDIKIGGIPEIKISSANDKKPEIKEKSADDKKPAYNNFSDIDIKLDTVVTQKLGISSQEKTSAVSKTVKRSVSDDFSDIDIKIYDDIVSDVKHDSQKNFRKVTEITQPDSVLNDTEIDIPLENESELAVRKKENHEVKTPETKPEVQLKEVKQSAVNETKAPEQKIQPAEERTPIISTDELVKQILNEQEKRERISALDYFIIAEDKDRVPVQNSISSAKAYIDRVARCGIIGDFLESYPDARTYLKNFEVFRKKLENALHAIIQDFDTIEKSHISEEVTGRIFRVVESEIIKKWMLLIYTHLHMEDSGFYIEFIRTLNKYLRSIGIYTCDIIKEGEVITDKAYEYFETDFVVTQDKELKGCVGEIRLLPYAVNYVNRNKKDVIHSWGAAKVYRTEN